MMHTWIHGKFMEIMMEMSQDQQQFLWTKSKHLTVCIIASGSLWRKLSFLDQTRIYFLSVTWASFGSRNEGELSKVGHPWQQITIICICLHPDGFRQWDSPLFAMFHLLISLHMVNVSCKLLSASNQWLHEMGWQLYSSWTKPIHCWQTNWKWEMWKSANTKIGPPLSGYQALFSKIPQAVQWMSNAWQCSLCCWKQLEQALGKWWILG